MRFLSVLLVAASIAGCGFQLRGAAVLPEGVERLHVQAPDALRQELAVFLEGSSTTLVDERAAADVGLRMLNPRFDERVLSVDPNTGKEREFELAYTVEIGADRGDGEVLIANQQVTVVRDYVFDSDAVIGKSREREVLEREMRSDLVRQVLYRLQSASGG